jgi:hypothetical protein
MDLEKTEGRDDCVGGGQLKFIPTDRPTDLGASSAVESQLVWLGIHSKIDS